MSCVPANDKNAFENMLASNFFTVQTISVDNVRFYYKIVLSK